MTVGPSSLPASNRFHLPFLPNGELYLFHIRAATSFGTSISGFKLAQKLLRLNAHSIIVVVSVVLMYKIYSWPSWQKHSRHKLMIEWPNGLRRTYNNTWINICTVYFVMWNGFEPQMCYVVNIDRVLSGAAFGLWVMSPPDSDTSEPGASELVRYNGENIVMCGWCTNVRVTFWQGTTFFFQWFKL